MNLSESVRAVRLAKEHPGETVVDRNTGRVFGDLMPTRAFGKS